MSDEECDIFKFAGSGGLNVGRKRGPPGRLKKTSLKRKLSTVTVSDSSSSSSSDEDEEDDKGRRRRLEGKRSLAVSRLLSNKAPRLSGSEDTDKVETLSNPGERSPSLSLHSSPSRSPRMSPLPSPPPPGFDILDENNGTSFRVLNQANDVLNRLQYSRFVAPTVLPDIDIAPGPPVVVSDTMNLRVRCKGKVHRYNVEMSAPLSQVISLLSEDLALSSEEKLLLSHKTATLLPTESPLSRSLSTADIIDAVVMKQSDFPAQEASSLAADSVTTTGDGIHHILVKVQTDSIHKVYKISKDDPLIKIMSAFSSELKIPTSQLKFLFDGDNIKPNQTANDIDMEENDCIDVMKC